MRERERANEGEREREKVSERERERERESERVRERGSQCALTSWTIVLTASSVDPVPCVLVTEVDPKYCTTHKRDQ